MPGRAGLNPLRFETTYIVDEQAAAELQRIAEKTGLLRAYRASLERGNSRPPSEPGAFSFLGTFFKSGPDAFRVRSKPDEADLAEMTRWVREASHYADLVLVSMHCHENGDDKSKPPEFLVEFAHACIEAGAHLFIGHGPHALRGLEIYQGKPIFYSLSDFFYQAEFVMTLPGENYLRPEMRDWTPLDFHEHFTQHETRQSPADPRVWETVVPACVFDDGDLRHIRLYPANLGFGQKLARRGTPRLVDGEQAEQTLNYFAELSKPFGTSIVVEDGIGRVRVG
jgi:poly-gamma-glutamate synthesis protein (capsule biosynthesis protein)